MAQVTSAKNLSTTEGVAVAVDSCSHLPSADTGSVLLELVNSHALSHETVGRQGAGKAYFVPGLAFVSVLGPLGRVWSLRMHGYKRGLIHSATTLLALLYGAKSINKPFESEQVRATEPTSYAETFAASINCVINKKSGSDPFSTT